MKRLSRGHSHESLAHVGHVRNLLEQSGIDCIVKNEQLSGGLGEIPFLECLPELWVLRDADLRRAQAFGGAVEAIEGQFAACWQPRVPGPTFRPYRALLPRVAAGWALGAPCERSGGRIGLDGVLRAVRGRRSAQVAVEPADDGEGSDLRVRDGVFSSRGLARAGGGRGFRVLAAGLSEPPDESFRRRHLGDFKRLFVEVVRLAAETGVNFGCRDEGSGERLQAQGR